MVISDQSIENIEAFLSLLEVREKAYRFCTLRYVALKSAGDLVLFKAELAFHSNPSAASARRFEAENAIAVRVRFSDIGLTTRQLIDQILTGRLSIGNDTLVFPASETSPYQVHFREMDLVGSQQQSHRGLLQIVGRQRDSYVSYPETDWALKAAQEPYDDLQELLTDFDLAQQQGAVVVEFALYSPVTLASAAANAVGRRNPTLVVAEGIQDDQVSLGYRVVSFEGDVVDRGRIAGRDLDWRDIDGIRIGAASIPVPPQARLYAVANFEGAAVQFGWVPGSTDDLNPRHTAFELCDRNFKIYDELMAMGSVKGNDGRVLEIAVSWLAWMLGFGAAFIGAEKGKLTDNPDLLFGTPKGHIMVVECTTGLLAPEKVQKLVHRTGLIRRAVQSSNASEIRILPLLITSRPFDEVEADVHAVHDQGVLVVTKSDLIRLFERSKYPVDADQLFAAGVRDLETELE